MIMEVSEDWSLLLENTFAQVTEVLGENTIMGMVEEDTVVTRDSWDDSDQMVTLTMDPDRVLVEDVEDLKPLQSEMSMQEEEKEEEAPSDISEDLSPQQRERCNTWPRRHLGSSRVKFEETSQTSPRGPPLPFVSEEGISEHDERDEEPLPHSSFLGSGNILPKMNSRRNPWGNYSYADLITQAIQSSPDHRLTLSQIYDWMISTVPYFQERADPNTSAGWKNSIRHNLSLHQKFLKVQNEGAGKSSWWTINPEKKVTVKPRRRATSGDTRALQLKRDKVRRRIEANKINGRLVRTSSTTGLSSPSPSFEQTNSSTEPFRPRSKSSASSLDCSPPPGLFSTFRPRTLSNASSVGGPLSPLHQTDQMDSDFSLPYLGPTHLSLTNPTLNTSDTLLNLPDFDILNSLRDGAKRRMVAPDLDNIALDDLTLDGGPCCDTENIIRDYLLPREPVISCHQLSPVISCHKSSVIRGSVNTTPAKIKILEPRDPDGVVSSVIKHTSAENSGQGFVTSGPFLSSLSSEETMERHDEVRNTMILNELKSLIQKRQRVQENQSGALSINNQKNLESAFDIKIRLLEEELQKLGRSSIIKKASVISHSVRDNVEETEDSDKDDRMDVINDEDINNLNYGTSRDITELLMFSKRAPEVTTSCV